MNLYRIVANVSVYKGDWRSVRQIPTFLLDGDCLGIADERHAMSVARDILCENLFPDGYRLSLDCIKVEPTVHYVDPQLTTFDQLRIGDYYRYVGGQSQFRKVGHTEARLQRGMNNDRIFTESPDKEVVLTSQEYVVF